MKKALITGVTGQDGSYLTELLLDKGYEVHGIVRRASSPNTERIDHLFGEAQKQGQLTAHYGDLSDSSGLARLIDEIEPDEVYNLGAQSHVKVSFEQAEYTADITGLGALRLLEIIRHQREKSGRDIRYYQASSSEMFGSAPPPQSLKTPFHPRSPYGVAKVYAFWQTVNHRESYDMFACNGILFNHECVAENTPLLVRANGVFNVVAARTLVPLLRKGSNAQHFEPKNLDVWDGTCWTAVTAITATKRRQKDADHCLLSVQARGGAVDVTAHHHMIDSAEQVCRADQVREGDSMRLADKLPASPGWSVLPPEMAEFLGLMSAEGYVPLQRGTPQFTNNDPSLRERVAQLWKSLFLGESYEWVGASGWNPRQGVVQMNLTGARAAHEWLRQQLYADDGHKRVPPLVLNATPDLQARYLQGHYAGDGLKAGKGESIKTSSALLAQGLFYLYANQGRLSSVYVEQRDGRSYYQLNIFASQTGAKGAHLRKDASAVRRVVPAAANSEWVFDLETASGVFCAGVGRLVVHNSPRRGETFVTRKITRAVGRIKLGLQKKLYLGNLDAKRDWGHARDYVEAMYLMLQQETPSDYVIATGEAHSVREFAAEAFAHVGLDYTDYIEVDPRFYRPAEVEYLLGDPSATNQALDWTPKISFEELVREMTEADLKLAEQECVMLKINPQAVLKGIGNE